MEGTVTSPLLRVLGPHSPLFSCQVWQQAPKPSCTEQLWGGHQSMVGASANVLIAQSKA